MGLGSGGNPLGYEGKASVPGKERASTEVGWKPVTVLRVLGLCLQGRQSGDPAGPGQGVDPCPCPARRRLTLAVSKSHLFHESHPASWTWRLWGRLCSPVNRARLSYFKSWREFPVSRFPDGLKIADQNVKLGPSLVCVCGTLH